MKKQNGECHGKAEQSSQKSLNFQSGNEWIVAKNLENALSAAQKSPKHRFVAGNTSTGGCAQLFG